MMKEILSIAEWRIRNYDGYIDPCWTTKVIINIEFVCSEKPFIYSYSWVSNTKKEPYKNIFGITKMKEVNILESEHRVAYEIKMNNGDSFVTLESPTGNNYFIDDEGELMKEV